MGTSIGKAKARTSAWRYCQLFGLKNISVYSVNCKKYTRREQVSSENPSTVPLLSPSCILHLFLYAGPLLLHNHLELLLAQPVNRKDHGDRGMGKRKTHDPQTPAGLTVALVSLLHRGLA